MPVLVQGTVTRGSTVARNALSNGKRSMSEQIEKDKVRNQPVLIRNYYMNPFYFFGWTEMAKDMEA